MKPRKAGAGQGGQSLGRLTSSLTQALRGGHTQQLQKNYFQKSLQKLQKLLDPTRMPSHTAKNALTFLKTGYPCTYQKVRGLLHYSNRILEYSTGKPAPSAQKRAQRVAQRVGVAGGVSDMWLSTPTLSTQYALVGSSQRGAVAA